MKGQKICTEMDINLPTATNRIIKVLKMDFLMKPEFHSFYVRTKAPFNHSGSHLRNSSDPARGHLVWAGNTAVVSGYIRPSVSCFCTGQTNVLKLSEFPLKRGTKGVKRQKCCYNPGPALSGSWKSTRAGKSYFIRRMPLVVEWTCDRLECEVA